MAGRNIIVSWCMLLSQSVEMMQEAIMIDEEPVHIVWTSETIESLRTLHDSRVWAVRRKDLSLNKQLNSSEEFT